MTILSLISALKVVFWISFLIVFYSYVGYAILMLFLVLLKKLFTKRGSEQLGQFFPNIAIVVAAFNEEDYIVQKIENCFALDYPREQLEIIFVTDGSKDKTVELVKQHSSVRHFHQPERKGKVAAINRIIPFIQSPFIIFCDANTLLNKESIKEIVKHYVDPRVGGVAGEKKILQHKSEAAAASGESLYWKYESFLKKLDSNLNTTVGAAGELFSLRRELFEPVPEGTIIEDFVQSLTLCKKGYVIRYEPRAFAAEGASATMKDEMTRKIRICAGGFQAMILLKELFNIFRYPLLSFQFISHRILRWTICPLALFCMVVANLLIVIFEENVFFEWVLILQAVFYAMAVLGWVLAKKNIRIKILYAPFYFVFMNTAVVLGFIRFIRKKQSVVWEKAARQSWQ